MCVYLLAYTCTCTVQCMYNVQYILCLQTQCYTIYKYMCMYIHVHVHEEEKAQHGLSPGWDVPLTSWPLIVLAHTPCMHTHTPIHTHTHPYTHTHTLTHTHTHTHSHTHTQMYHLLWPRGCAWLMSTLIVRASQILRFSRVTSSERAEWRKKWP